MEEKIGEKNAENVVSELFSKFRWGVSETGGFLFLGKRHRRYGFRVICHYLRQMANIQGEYTTELRDE